MGCTDSVCGTGGWTGPKPGDPDNNSLISAQGVIGGIEVSWTYPNTNPHAVSYFILYRGLSASFAGATQRALVGGNKYFDRIPDEDYREYFYWIQIVSINGTTGDLIGPAAAHPLGLIENIIQGLTGQIDAGVLATALRTKIDRISIISGELEGETAERIAAHAELSEALAAVQSDADQALTFIKNETTARTTADTAIVTSVNTIAAGVQENAAAILEQQTTSADADEALANDITLLYAKTKKTDAALLTETTARTAADAALANQITTAQTTLNGQIASAQTTLQTEINTTNGRVTNIGARWTAVVDVNGMIGGFGVYNNGAFVEAGFDVDRFWVGRTVNKMKPFIIDGKTVYINSAMIASASIDNAKIANAAITNAKIANAEITSLKVAGNNITTVVAGEYFPGAVIVAQPGNSTPQWGSGNLSIFFTVAPQSVVILVSVTASNNNDATNVATWVARDDEWILANETSTARGFTQSHVNHFVDYPSAGWHNYKIGFGNGYNGGRWSINRCSITILATLR